MKIQYGEDDTSPPVSRACPACGSSRFRRVNPQNFALVYDRLCRDCETRYTPPTPAWLHALQLPAGFLLLGLIAGLAGLAWRDREDPGLYRNLGPLGAGLGFLGLLGVVCLRRGFEWLRDRDEPEDS